MDLAEIHAGELLRSTPVKSPERFRSKYGEKGNAIENRNPNFSSAASSPVVSGGNKSVKKSGLRDPNLIVSGKKKITERRFVVAKKRSNKANSSSDDVVSCKCVEKFGLDANKKKRCLCTAYERLRASQEEFFKSRDNDEDAINGDDDDDVERDTAKAEIVEGEEIAKNDEEMNEPKSENALEEVNQRITVGNSMIKRRREMVMEEARKSVPELGAGKVKHLVNAFEKLRLIQASMVDEKEKKISQWALPGMQVKVSGSEPNESLSSINASDLFLTSENLGLDLHNASSWDSGQGSFSISNRISGGEGRRSRRTSMESSCTMGGRKWKKKQPRVTSLKPFKLRTEERGRLKEEELMKKIEKMMEEQEKLRIPVAQGLPWTTDEPECLVKPPVKEITKPIDITLHTDLRAVERAEFDQQVAEKLGLIEQYRTEKERLQKLAEEEETRRLRRELVPKAQPMPYFDRPFIPRRSMKHPTIPKEPKLHVPRSKKIKGSLSWNDIGPYTYNAGL